MTLTKNDLINKLHFSHSLTKMESYRSIETILEVIKQTLESGEDVLISGFGKFYLTNKKSRKGRNPETGNELILDARRIVSFKCASKFKERINID